MSVTIKAPLLKMEGQFSIFPGQIIFQITSSDKKRFKSPKAWGVIYKFAAVNIKFTGKFTTQQKICEPHARGHMTVLERNQVIYQNYWSHKQSVILY